MNNIWHPSEKEVERLRLILSTFQDGTGMLMTKDGRNLPGWRDFERACAAAFNGRAVESKALFDVLLPNPINPATHIGLSCKMRGTLNRIARDDRVTIEVANSDKEFWTYLNTKGINQTNWMQEPFEVGAGLIHVVEQWHHDASIQGRGTADTERSSYFTLQWSTKGDYQLFQFPLTLPDPKSIRWSFPSDRRILGETDTGMIFEWYGRSGGQLKYYPLARNAVWKSAPFQLEVLTESIERGLAAKVAAYFPDKWAEVSDSSQ